MSANIYVEKNMLDSLKNMENQLSEVATEQKILDAQLEDKKRTIEMLQNEVAEGKKTKEEKRSLMAATQKKLETSRWLILGKTLESMVEKNTGKKITFDFLKEFKSSEEFVNEFSTYILLATAKQEAPAATAVPAEDSADAVTVTSKAVTAEESDDRKPFPKRNEYHKPDKNSPPKENYHFFSRM